MSNEDLFDRANQIIRLAEARNVRLRLLGGLAIMAVSPLATKLEALRRDYADIDFVGLGRDKWKIKQIFNDLGYVADERFNALHGRTRLLFYEVNGQRHIDIFLDYFQMCHRLDLRQRLFPGYTTLSLVDLLITKLQVVQMNEKDLMDILAILLEHEVKPDETQETIDINYLIYLIRNDWGLYTTISDNLKRVLEELSLYIDAPQREIVIRRIEYMLNAIEAAPKSTAWRLRAKIGRKMEWYELPDEVNR